MAPKKSYYKPKGKKVAATTTTSTAKSKAAPVLNGQALVVVEAPGKVHKIQGYLGPNYIVMASVGHIMDLPKKGLGIDLDNNYDPTYEVMPGKEEVVEGLIETAQKVSTIYLFADADREGEAIAYSVAVQLKRPGVQFYRATSSAITKAAIQAAIANPRQLDKSLVRAQQARRILDRLVGFKTSPLLWSTVRKGLSAGRVQSVALRMIVDQQELIDAFKPRDYWTIQATLKTKKNEPFTAEIKVEYDTEVDADAVVQKLQAGLFTVKTVDSKLRSRSPAAPFTTSQMLQQAHTILGWGAKRTNSAAQTLYEGAWTTYIRTDSTFIDPAAVTDIRTYLTTQGPKYIPANALSYKNSVNAQEAHEAIRPTNMSFLPSQTVGQMPPDAQTLYELVWKRAIASQATDAQFQQVLVSIDNQGTELSAKGQTLVFDGFLKFWTYSDSKEVTLPALTPGETLSADKIETVKHTTKPPARYNSGSIIKELEESGVGRPSTYQAIIDTLTRRMYITEEGKAFAPTPIGKEVVKILKQAVPRVVDTAFTADMELKLDEVAAGKLDWVTCIDTFWKPLALEIEAAQKILAGMEMASDKKCLKCGKPLLRKINNRGAFYCCSERKACGSIFQIGDNEEPIVREREVHATPCPLCQGKMVKRFVKKTGKFFWGCENYDTTGCKSTLDDAGQARTPIIKKIVGCCDKCGKGNMVIKPGSRGPFVACDAYPKCRNAKSLKDFGIDADGNKV